MGFKKWPCTCWMRCLPVNSQYQNCRIDESSAYGNASMGEVRWNPRKFFFLIVMLVSGVVGGILFFSWSAVALFFVSSAVTLCLGHSIGMHRKLIHDSFQCPAWLEQLFVYLGSLVGLGGPFTLVYVHDLRDWAQRQGDCHDYFGHRRELLSDAWWQNCCDIHLQEPPSFSFGRKLESSHFYRWLEKTALWQQLPWALLFYLIGGWGWVFWGVCLRVAVSVIGHWLVGYFAHNRGGQHWKVEGASVQGYDVKFCGLITFGECWHNNHHAFPGSAKLGLYKNQMDPGWAVLKLLQKCRLVTNLKTPSDLPNRPELVPL